MCIERPPGDPSDWTIERWAEQRVTQLVFAAVGRADLVPNPWELPLVDALEESGDLSDQTAIVLRDVDAFVLSRDQRFPGRLAAVDITLGPNRAHVDWIRLAADSMRTVGYDTVPILMASNVDEDMIAYALSQSVRVLWWEPLRHHVEWHGPRPGFEDRSATLSP